MKIEKNKLLLLFAVIVETVLIRTFIYDILPSKYFYDSMSILSIIGGFKTADRSYMFVANIYKLLNIFNFVSLSQWAIVTSMIFTFILLFIILKKKNYSIIHVIFIIASFALLNIYVFGPTKECIQLFFCIIIYAILTKENISNFKKIVLVSSILIIESFYFRIYYALIGFLMITLFFVYVFFFEKKGMKYSKNNIVKLIFIISLLFFLQVFVLSKISTSNYNSLLNARYSANIGRETSPDAVTIIVDLFGRNTSILTFILNYVINFLRILFPVELFLKGIKYVPFILYQLFVSYTLFKGIKIINTKNCVFICSFLAFFMVSVIFEPDFGSFIKHESNMFLIIMNLALKNSEEREMINNENNV